MEKIILIGLGIIMILISGCNNNWEDFCKDKDDCLIFGNITNMSILINNSCFENVSYPPIDKFCNNRDMMYFKGTLFRDAGCIDNNGEYHYYKITYNKLEDKWIIGNETYSPDWECK